MAEHTSHPELEIPYTLSSEQIEAYRMSGYVCLREVASRQSVHAYAPAIEEALQTVATRKDSQSRLEDYGSLFQQVTNVWRLNELARRFVFAGRFARIAAELMGVKGVRLYHDQALFKPPGGSATPWHQDQFYWPLDTSHTVTMWMPLHDLTRTMGTLLFAGGSHLNGPLYLRSISSETHRLYEQLIAEKALPVESFELAAGDATFHSGWTLHSTHPNSGTSTRKVITVIYYMDGATITEPDSDFRRVDMQVFFPGQLPGEKAASPLNPLLYQSAAR